MRKLIPVYIRIPLLFALMFGLVEYFVDSGDKPAFIKYPVIGLFHLIFIFILIAIEVVMNSVDKVSYHLLSEEERKAFDAEQKKPVQEQQAYKNWMFKLTDLKPMEQEKDLELDHDFDGIKELNNGLPPWFTYLFYSTIVFALVYLVRFHIIGDYTQDEEFATEMKIADAKVEEYKKTAPDLMDKEKVTLLTEAGDLAAGKTLFEANCVACHRADAGGAIGPNLTDSKWILGGGIKNVFNTIMEGGRAGKGMVPWKESIKPSDIQKIASYVLSLQGTNPKDPKPTEPEAKEWKEGAATPAPTSDAPVTTVVDSTAKK